MSVITRKKGTHVPKQQAFVPTEDCIKDRIPGPRGWNVRHVLACCTAQFKERTQTLRDEREAALQREARGWSVMGTVLSQLNA